MKHKWECISPGEYDSTYKCLHCKATRVKSIDNPETELPEDGCTANISKEYRERLSSNAEEFDSIVADMLEDIEKFKNIILDIRKHAIFTEDKSDEYCFGLVGYIKDVTEEFANEK